ncbi:hypothetical protein [Microcystis aeruginosa]|uniref:hypothetical protein n=1 Tax=Microcystis aeruginosa TaxID=1126 RepID=UPI001C11FCEA|nr:hypothetical protein [Microcystis aeruginosa]
MTTDLNTITRNRIPARKVINQYKEGRRDFRNLDLRNSSFKKQDLCDADWEHLTFATPKSGFYVKLF